MRYVLKLLTLAVLAPLVSADERIDKLPTEHLDEAAALFERAERQEHLSFTFGDDVDDVALDPELVARATRFSEGPSREEVTALLR